MNIIKKGPYKKSEDPINILDDFEILKRLKETVKLVDVEKDTVKEKVVTLRFCRSEDLEGCCFLSKHNRIKIDEIETISGTIYIYFVYIK